jgi:ribosome-associated protein
VDDKKPQAKRSAARSKGAAAARPKSSAARKTPRPAREVESAGAKSARPKRASLPPSRPDPNAQRREQTKKIAIAAALAALDKKAERVEIVDIGEKVDYADYLVVMTGRSDRQVVAIAQGIEDALEQQGIHTRGHEGKQQGQWVLIDIGDVIVHVFLDEARRYYDLEGLWLDAPRVPTPSFVPPTGDGSGMGARNRES